MIFESLSSLSLPWTVYRNLWILLPLLPLGGALLMLAAGCCLPRDISGTILLLTVVAQLVLAAVLVATAGALGPDAREIALSLWDYPIVFRVEPVKLMHLGVLMTPLFLSLPKYHRIDSPYLRVIFLFYLAGCSGLIVTGDIFNFFVFYELMIMAAYVLVAMRQAYGESIKYMMFGSISSIAFLGGIIVLYAGGAPFAVQPEHYAALPPANAWWAMILFTLAFSVKSAFFPIALAPCHAAAGSLVSAFLASFTIFTGMMGLHHFVLQPAALLGQPAFHLLIRTLSVLTIAMSSLILYWEPEYNRAVAQSTITAVGLAGLLLSFGMHEAAFTFVLIHALYKSLLFMLGDDLTQNARLIRVSTPLTLGMLAVGVLLAAGLYPGLPALYKDAAGGEAWWLQAVLLFSSLCTIGGFAKFRYERDRGPRPDGRGWRTRMVYLGAAVLLALAYLQLGIPRAGGAAILADLAVFSTALLLAKPLYRRFPALVSMDRHWIYGQLNRQLFYILILFCCIAAWLARGALVGK